MENNKLNNLLKEREDLLRKHPELIELQREINLKTMNLSPIDKQIWFVSKISENVKKMNDLMNEIKLNGV